MNSDFQTLTAQKLSALGVNPHPNLQRFGSLVELFDYAFATHRDREACASLGHVLLFKDLDRLSASFAAWLQQDSGLHVGDRIAVQMPNLSQYLVVVLGALRAGMVVVNTNPLYTERELTHQLNDAQVRLLVVQANVAQTAAKVLPNTCVEQVIVTELADLHPFPKRLLINFAVKHIKKLVPPYAFANALSLTDILRKDRSRDYQKVALTADTMAMLQYTGGTTGVAKGAMLSHGNLVANVLQVDEMFGTQPLKGEGDTMLQPLPVYHIYAFTTSVYCLFKGTFIVFVPNPRDLDALVKDFATYQPHLFCGLNTLFVALCQHEGFRQIDFSRLKTTLSGGMALTTAAANRWEEITGCPVSEGYGLTETSPVATSNPGNGRQLGTIGLPLPYTELMVTDDDGNDLGFEQPGELCIRGPQVMMGYWQRPEATAEVLTEDGWFRTGDIAVLQADGYTRIVDRKKDMIVVSGFNVYPNEIEDVMVGHPGILECAAIGVSDEKTGEAIRLFVVVSDATLTTETIRDYAREHLTGYKVPKQIVFRDELPKSNVGKILRRELRDTA
jgi:long-chain acyl-CoA synthetase